MLVVPGPLRVADLDIDVVVTPNRRNVRLTVERDARVTARVPVGLASDLLTELVKSRLRWIYEKLDDRTADVSAQQVREFVAGEGFLYLGRNYRLQIVDKAAPPVGLVHGRLQLRHDRLDHAEEDLIAWYRARGQAWLPRRVSPWAERMRAPLDDIVVRRLGYRWGSCSPRGGLNIHWAIMQLPVALIDYVLVHELAHLHQHDHTAAFWQVVRCALPDFQARRSRLDVYGPRLWLPEPATRSILV